ncbi:hypothetical protein [Pseudonocardia oceani]|uniref:hypothetical protein n=1 Tax=Pseudonocardia oceani TaxID=2792013 RepID=UPI001C4A5F04|nr:hypothetical protein [Pseudonocardia oceani]
MTAPVVDVPAREAQAVVDAYVSTPDGPIRAPMVAALESAWAAIRARHPEVPAVVMVHGAGSIGNAGGLRLGHFAAMRWADPGQPTGEQGGDAVAVRLPEVLVGGEGLAPGPADVLGALLHEAAHALAHVRDVKDTSRQGRWHNARFKALAGELGIEVTKTRGSGGPRRLSPPTPARPSAEVIDELGRVLRLHRSVEIGDRKERKPTPPPCGCECGRKIRVAPTVLAAGPKSAAPNSPPTFLNRTGRRGSEYPPAPAARFSTRRPRPRLLEWPGTACTRLRSPPACRTGMGTP